MNLATQFRACPRKLRHQIKEATDGPIKGGHRARKVIIDPYQQGSPRRKVRDTRLRYLRGRMQHEMVDVGQGSWLRAWWVVAAPISLPLQVRDHARLIVAHRRSSRHVYDVSQLELGSMAQPLVDDDRAHAVPDQRDLEPRTARPIMVGMTAHLGNHVTLEVFDELFQQWRTGHGMALAVGVDLEIVLRHKESCGAPIHHVPGAPSERLNRKGRRHDFGRQRRYQREVVAEFLSCATVILQSITDLQALAQLDRIAR